MKGFGSSGVSSGDASSCTPYHATSLQPDSDVLHMIRSQKGGLVNMHIYSHMHSHISYNYMPGYMRTVPLCSCRQPLFLSSTLTNIFCQLLSCNLWVFTVRDCNYSATNPLYLPACLPAWSLNLTSHRESPDDRFVTSQQALVTIESSWLIQDYHWNTQGKLRVLYLLSEYLTVSPYNKSQN